MAVAGIRGIAAPTEGQLLEMVRFDKYYQVEGEVGPKAVLRQRRFAKGCAGLNYGQFVALLRQAYAATIGQGREVAAVCDGAAFYCKEVWVRAYRKDGRQRLRLCRPSPNLIGSGLRSTVYACTDEGKGRPLASKNTNAKDALRELELINRIHDAIAANPAIAVQAAYETRPKGDVVVKQLVVLMDRPLFRAGASLFLKYYHPLETAHMPLHDRLGVAIDVKLGMSILLKAGFVNTDLKVSNIRWRADCGRAVIIDLGDVKELKGTVDDAMVRSICHGDPEAEVQRRRLNKHLSDVSAHTRQRLGYALKGSSLSKDVANIDPPLAERIRELCATDAPQQPLSAEQCRAVTALLEEKIKACWVAHHYHSLATTLMHIIMPSLVAPTTNKQTMEKYLIYTSTCLANIGEMIGLDWRKISAELLDTLPEYGTLPPPLQRQMKDFFGSATPLPSQMQGLARRLYVLGRRLEAAAATAPPPS